MAITAKHEDKLPPPETLTNVRATGITSSTSVAINAASTLLEISAINGEVFFLEGTGTVTASTWGFSWVVLSGTTRHYTIPRWLTAIQVISTTGEAIVITY